MNIRASKTEAPATPKGWLAAMKRLMVLGLVAVVFAGSGVGGWMMWRWLDHPVAVIRVKGAFKHIEQGELESLVAPVIRGGLISLNLSEINRVLVDHVWIREASLSREWPDALLIEFVEEEPIARWGDRGFLNSRGQLLDIQGNAGLENLPLLVTSDNDRTQLMRRYREAAELLGSEGLKIGEMHLAEDGNVTVKLSGGPELLVGRFDMMDKLQRFLVVWNRALVSSEQTPERIDLRYGNSLAVRWAQEEAAPESKNI
ncbi:MAG: cell division protein FtsQ/DivIB [bacterium]